MRDRPNVRDQQLVGALEKAYAISVAALKFLPIGNDAAAAVFRVQCEQRAYFLKLRKGRPNLASLTVPQYLREKGIDSVVAPVLTSSGELFAELGEYSLILYPWIAGRVQVGQDAQPAAMARVGGDHARHSPHKLWRGSQNAFASRTVRQALDEQTGKS